MSEERGDEFLASGTLIVLVLIQQMAIGSGIQDGKHIVHQTGSMPQYRQNHIPVWFDSNRCHHPQTDKWKTVCSLAGTHTVPPPWGRCAGSRSAGRRGGRKPCCPTRSQRPRRSWRAPLLQPERGLPPTARAGPQAGRAGRPAAPPSSSSDGTGRRQPLAR